MTKKQERARLAKTIFVYTELGGSEEDKYYMVDIDKKSAATQTADATIVGEYKLVRLFAVRKSETLEPIA